MGPSWLAYRIEPTWASHLWNATRSVTLRSSYISKAAFMVLAGLWSYVLWGLPLRRKEEMERYLPELAGVNSSFKSCNKWAKFALGKCLLSFCYQATWLLQYIGRVLSIKARERQILTGMAKHIKAREYKAVSIFQNWFTLRVMFCFLTSLNETESCLGGWHNPEERVRGGSPGSQRTCVLGQDGSKFPSW